MKKTVTVSLETVKQFHKEACSDWKSRIERQLPEAFTSTNKTFRAGSIVTGLAYSRVSKYIIATVAADTIQMINLADGNRWSSPMAVSNAYAITVKELRSHINSGWDERTVTVDGEPVSQTKSQKTSFKVPVDFIKAGYEAANKELRKLIAAAFPEVFPSKSEYVRLIPEGARNEPFSVHASSTTIDDDVNMIIGRGIVSSSHPELKDSCILVKSEDVEVELLEIGGYGYTAVAFKRKNI